MNFVQNLFKTQKEKNVTKKIFKYCNYKYTCNYCKTDKVKIDIIGLTEALYGPFMDSSGNTHECHDYNKGKVKLTCDNNHVSIVNYIAYCECGWSNNSSLT
jgi:hypothetical protein